MIHSIIIPHKGREAHLEHCLRSLVISGGAADYEILVVGQTSPAWIRSQKWLADWPIQFIVAETSPAHIHLYPQEPPPFWKTRLLNIGIEVAEGDVLTFLDADAIVGPGFMECAGVLGATSGLTLLSYRVRYMPATYYCMATQGSAAIPLRVWSHFNHTGPDGKYLYRKAHEAYGAPDRGYSEPCVPIFGNSQFSIRRNVLGALRFDESYFGRGLEDLDMMRSIHSHYGDQYQAAIVTAGSHAMFHVKHDFSPGYGQDRWSQRNERRYYGRKMIWATTGSSTEALRLSARINARIKNSDRKLPCHQVVAKEERPWQSEVNSERDEILDAEAFLETFHFPRNQDNPDADLPRRDTQANEGAGHSQVPQKCSRTSGGPSA